MNWLDWENMAYLVVAVVIGNAASAIIEHGIRYVAERTRPDRRAGRAQ